MSASCVTISNPDLLSSREAGVNPGLSSWKTYLIELDVGKPLMVSMSQRSEELRLYNLFSLNRRDFFFYPFGEYAKNLYISLLLVEYCSSFSSYSRAIFLSSERVLLFPRVSPERVDWPRTGIKLKWSWSEFDNLKPRVKSGIFKHILWLNASFFGGDVWGFWKIESRPIWRRQGRLSTRQLPFCLYMYSLWLHRKQGFRKFDYCLKSLAVLELITPINNVFGARNTPLSHRKWPLIHRVGLEVKCGLGNFQSKRNRSLLIGLNTS